MWLRGPDCNTAAELSALQLQETRKQTEGNENENESKSVEQKVTVTVLRCNCFRNGVIFVAILNKLNLPVKKYYLHS
jgi:hypothetical protein